MAADSVKQAAGGEAVKKQRLPPQEEIPALQERRGWDIRRSPAASPENRAARADMRWDYRLIVEATLPAICIRLRFIASSNSALFARVRGRIMVIP